MEKLVLIDGNSLINRAFYATPVFTTKDGLPTNGIFGFIKLMLKIISDKKPTYFSVAFDVHAPTFRHKAYADYKAGRKPMPQELAVQIPLLKEVLKLMNVNVQELTGFEADDIIGTMAKKFDVQTYIYTGDRDAYQLVDETTNVCFTRKGVSDILELSLQNFKDEIGLTPNQIIDYKALMGDKSDNIPGVAGVGEKSALTLLAQYGDLNGVYSRVGEISGALHNKLVNGKENAYFSRELATINTDAPIVCTLSDCLLKMPFSKAVKNKFAELEFKSLLGLNIFSDEENTPVLETVHKQAEYNQAFPENVSIAINELKNGKFSKISCYWSEKEFIFALLPENYDINDSLQEYVFPVKYSLLDAGFYDYQLKELFQEIFNGNKRLILYNAKDVMHRLRDLDITLSAPFDDVAILKCISDGLANANGLDFCLSYHNLPEKYKACGLAWLSKYYFNRLNEQEKKLYGEVELPLVRVLFDMETEGVCVDENTLDELAVRYQKEREDITREIYRLAGVEFNVNSTQQLGKVLFEDLKIAGEPNKKKDGKKYKTTAEELEKYAGEYEIVRLILRYRKVQKLASTYIDGFKPLLKNGKIHTTYNQNNTATGRLSSTNPNLQNIPIRTDEGRELRKLFKASAGNVLIDADYSQIELRLAAHFADCKGLIDAYRQGADIHATTASQVFHVPLKDVSGEQRRAAKAVNFGIIYGISAFGLGQDLNIPPQKAKTYIDKYFETYPELKEYLAQNVSVATNQGFVTTLLGRRRVINELQSSNHYTRSFGERAAMNMPIQGSSADIIKLAMIHVHEELKSRNLKAKLVLQVHDELVIDCPKNEREEVQTLLKECMENAVSLHVPLTVDVGVGENWYQTK